MLKAKFAQTKDCEHCGQSFERKRGRMTDAAWAKARFCCVAHYHAWQREQGPRGSSGRIEECAAPECSRTFWAHGSQKFCRDPQCAATRNREMARLHIERHGEPHELFEFDQEVRDGELRRLIRAQEQDQKHGHRFMADSKNGLSVLRLEDVIFHSAASNQAEPSVDHIELLDDPSGIPRVAARPRHHSHVPIRRPSPALQEAA